MTWQRGRWGRGSNVATCRPPTPSQVDVRLKSFDAASKIKIIKAVRGVTNLGLKEVRVCVVVGSEGGGNPRTPPLPALPPQAKDLVESAPCTILTGVKREEAAKVVEKLKAEVPAEYELV